MNYPTFNQYIHLTNLGAHFSTGSSQVNAERAALQLLLNNAITPKLKDYLAALKTDSDIPAFQQVIALFNQGYITAADFPTELKGQSFELNLAKRNLLIVKEYIYLEIVKHFYIFYLIDEY